MKGASRLTGIVALAGVAVLIVAGARTPSGRSILEPLGEFFIALGRSLRDLLPVGPGNPVVGNGLLAVAVTLGLIVAGVLLVPAVRQGRGLAVLVAGSAVAGLLLYSPSLIGGAS